MKKVKFGTASIWVSELQAMKLNAANETPKLSQLLGLAIEDWFERLSAPEKKRFKTTLKAWQKERGL